MKAAPPTPASPTAPLALATPLAAIALMLAAMALIPAGDTAGKMLTDTANVAPAFVAFSRFALGALMILPFLGDTGISPRLFADWRIWLRGALIAGGIGSILTALSTETMANVFGAFFIGPILSYFLSALLLREKISWGQTALLMLGFAGVLVVVRPGFGMTAGTGFALLAGTCYGCFLVMSRWLSGIARPRALLFSQLVIGAIILAPFAVTRVPETLTLPMTGLVLASALGSMLGNLALVFAYRRAEASRLAPFIYTQLIAAAAYGYLFFGELPDAMTQLGLAILITAGAGSVLIRRR